MVVGQPGEAVSPCPRVRPSGQHSASSSVKLSSHRVTGHRVREHRRRCLAASVGARRPAAPPRPGHGSQGRARGRGARAGRRRDQCGLRGGPLGLGPRPRGHAQREPLASSSTKTSAPRAIQGGGLPASERVIRLRRASMTSYATVTGCSNLGMARDHGVQTRQHL
jgi:hypothetical protein